eukprot:SAG31_NODE_1963_length_6802_cov_2.758168_6_plen_89_part_00
MSYETEARKLYFFKKVLQLGTRGNSAAGGRDLNLYRALIDSTNLDRSKFKKLIIFLMYRYVEIGKTNTSKYFKNRSKFRCTAVFLIFF